jgi:signal transduction histidine kinase
MATPSPLGAFAELVRQALGVALVRVAFPAEEPSRPSPDASDAVPDAVPDALDSRFGADDPVGRALFAEVEQLGGPLAIEDTRAAPPLRGTATIGDLRIMACLAVPARDAAGRVQAVLCALDGVPRWWSERDLSLTTSIAQALGALLASEARAATAHTASNDGAAMPATMQNAMPTVMPLAATRMADATPRTEAPPARHSVEALRAVGELAGGVAHDFNNLLTVISANAELLRQVLDERVPGDLVARELDEIERATGDASELTWQLLAFGQQLPLEPVHLDLHEQLGALYGCVRSALPDTVALEMALTAPRSHVRLDPAHFEHALLALVSNAADAMPDGGVLRLHTALRGRACGHGQDDAGDEWLTLSVQDTGIGVPASEIGRLFDPFYSTKEVGRGRGLGLASVHGIVAQAGGHCTVESVAGSGTTVVVWLPLSRRDRDAH